MTDSFEPHVRKNEAGAAAPIAAVVRECFAEILERHVERESLADIAVDLSARFGVPMTGLQLRRAVMDDDSMTKSFNAVIEHRAHNLIEEATKLADQAAKLGDAAGLRVAIDTYIRIAGKIASGIYGEKSTHEFVGAGGGPIKHLVEMSPEDAYKAMLAKDAGQ